MGRTAADVEDIHFMLGQVMTEIASMKANTAAAMPQVTATLEKLVKDEFKDLEQQAEENTQMVMQQADTHAHNLSIQNEKHHQSLMQEIEAQAKAGAINHDEIMENFRHTSSGISDLVLRLSCGPDALNHKYHHEQLVEWLRFPRMHIRRDAIEPAYDKTFDWVLEERPVDGAQAQCFSQWISSNAGLFSIKGKAGSGKSTLVKTIAEHPRPRELLCTWAHDKALTLSTFYFSYTAKGETGVDCNSVAALLRSILLDILEAEPSLAQVAFPDWLLKFANEEPHLVELRTALGRILHYDGSLTKTCVLIDGIDEFQGSDNEAWKLCSLICEMAKSSNLKVLVSSRPPPLFELAFRGCQSLAIHELTSQDMRVFLEGQFKSEADMIITLGHDQDSIAELIEEIIKRSSGVFLWVKLVTEEILRGLQHGDRIQDLFRTLYETPPDLDAFFEYMLRKIPPRYRQEAARLLQVVQMWHVDGGKSCFHRDGVPALALSYATEFTTQQVLDLPRRRLTPAQYDEFYQRFDSKLKSRCFGLLELERFTDRRTEPSHEIAKRYSPEDSMASAVDFLHKSVADYLKRADGAKSILADTGFDFDVDIAIMRGLLGILKSESNWLQFSLQLETIMNSYRKVETSTGRPHIEIFEDIVFTVGEILWTLLDHRFRSEICEQCRGSYTERRKNRNASPQSCNKCREAINTRAMVLEDTLAAHFEMCKYNGPSPLRGLALIGENPDDLRLPVAIIHGAELTVKHYLAAIPKGSRLTRGRPLLQYAVDPIYGLDERPTVNLSIIQLLLEWGDDPNEIYERMTIPSETYERVSAWSLAMKAVSQRGHHFDGSPRSYDSDGPPMLRVFKLLLDHGADPKTTITTPHGRPIDATVVLQCTLECSQCTCKRSHLEAIYLAECSCCYAKTANLVTSELVGRLKSEIAKTDSVENVRSRSQVKDGYIKGCSVPTGGSRQDVDVIETTTMSAMEAQEGFTHQEITNGKHSGMRLDEEWEEIRPIEP